MNRVVARDHEHNLRGDAAYFELVRLVFNIAKRDHSVRDRDRRQPVVRLFVGGVIPAEYSGDTDSHATLPYLRPILRPAPDRPPRPNHGTLPRVAPVTASA